MKKLTITVIVLLLLISFSNPTCAENSLSGRLGEPLQPMEECNISLLSENLVFTHDGRYSATVKGEYILKNNGPADDVKIGILKYVYLREIDPGPEENRRLRNLAIYVNGTNITPDEFIETDQYRRDDKTWSVFEISFAEGETVTVNCEYEVSLAYQENGDLSFGYFLSKNANWAGDVGQSTLAFKVTDTFAYGIHSINRELKKGLIDNVYTSDLSGFTYNHAYPSGAIIYKNSDFEPVDDIEIIISNRAWPDYPNMAELRNENQNDSVEFFQYAPFNKGDQLKSLYNNLGYDTKLIETLYAKTKLDHIYSGQMPLAVRLDTGVRNGFTVYVEDYDFDFAKSCNLTVKDSSGNIIDSLTLDFNQQFGDYGEAVYYAYDKNSILESVNTYEVAVEDSDGNSAVTVFSSDKSIVSITVNGDEVEVSNPDTSASVPLFTFAVLLLLTGFTLLLLNKKLFMD